MSAGVAGGPVMQSSASTTSKSRDWLIPGDKAFSWGGIGTYFNSLFKFNFFSGLKILTVFISIGNPLLAARMS